MNNIDPNNTEQQNSIEPTDQINWLSAMMSADNDINQKELQVILEYGLQLGMSEEKIKRIVTTSIKGQEVLLRYLKLSRLSRHDGLMRALIRVIFADGKIAKEELEMLRLVAKKMNYTTDELKAILEDEKNKFQSKR